MQAAKPPRFRPTLEMRGIESRAAEPLHPAVAVDIVDGHATWNLGEWATREVEVPTDFVLHAVLETTDEDLAGFMASWGLLVRPYGHDWDALPHSGLALNPFLSPDYLARQDSAAPRAILDSRMPHVSIAACAVHLRLLRALSRHYLAFAEGDDDGILTAWREEDLMPYPYSDSLEDAWRRWILYVNAALHAFPPQVGLAVNDNRIDAGDGQGTPSTYEVAVLQLAQLATDGRRVLRCANETCGRPFTRQQSGRRQYAGTEHAEGVKYCSPQCAKAQSERERRRRRRDEGKKS